MFRRALPAGVAAISSVTPALSNSLRNGHHNITQHDWSKMWSHQLSPAETKMVEAQADRTVSAVVPGKFFMRHWIMTEQSTLSVVSRVVVGMVTVVVIIWAAGFGSIGINGHNCAHVAGVAMLLFATALHTYMLWILPAALGLSVLQLALN